MPSAVKDLMLKEVRDNFEANPYLFFSTFDKLPVAEMSELRRGLGKVAKRSLVVKHALARKVFEDLQIADTEPFLQGSVMVTMGDKDPQEISKAIIGFAKANKNFAPVGVVFEKKAYGEDFVKQLSKLPSRQELLTQAVVRIKSPISGFVMTLSQLMRGLVIALNEVKNQKSAAAA